MKTASWRMVSEVRSCVALDFDRFVVLPAMHERRNAMLRKGWCACPAKGQSTTGYGGPEWATVTC